MTGRPAVTAADEGRHEPGPENLWNESWYFDLADPSGAIGAYFRFGLYPNRRQTWWQLSVAGPDRKLVTLFDHTAPLATGPDLAQKTGSWSCELDTARPLERWTLRATATAQQLDDPLAVYRHERGTEVPVDVDLTWATTGAPYHYAVTTRYEVSCRVSGRITIGDEVIAIDAPGQRDHSWGVRDWWAFGWCWSAGALDDGTQFHMADIRFPSSSVGFGYVLDRDGTAQPASAITATETVDDEGFPLEARLAADPGLLSLTVEPLAFSPVLFVADDGRTSRFPRALCRYRADDGRTGTGWTEWNQL